jgi:hypothetical protein
MKPTAVALVVAGADAVCVGDVLSRATAIPTANDANTNATTARPVVKGMRR